MEALANTVKAVNGFAHDFSAKITTFANAVEKARAAYIDANFRRATEIAKLSEGFSASPYPPANNGGSSW